MSSLDILFVYYHYTMGVTYKLREEVVRFIISQRQSNPLASCRQLAEFTYQKFGLHLSKSSVHDVLKESGITTPRGRKPGSKFEIPQEKKKQIQGSLSQVNVKYLSPPNVLVGGPEIAQTLDSRQKHSGMTQEALPSVIASPKGEAIPEKTTYPVEIASSLKSAPRNDTGEVLLQKNDTETSPEYEGAGRIFLKAALWDLGIFSEENIKEADWGYYLTYSKGIKVVLENNKSFFIDLPLPLERCIRELVDGLVNNVKPFIVHKVSDEGLFKACIDAQAGFKIDYISIVDDKDHILLKLNDIMELKRNILLQNRVFVENYEKNFMERSKAIFFSQHINNNEVIDNMLNLKGFATTNKDENVVTLLINDSYQNKAMLQQAADKLNGMYLRDEQDRLVRVKIKG